MKTTSTSTFTTTLRQAVLAVSIIACAGAATQAVAGPFNWFSGEKVNGSGVLKKESRNLGHFTGVSFSLPGKLDLRMGNTEAITIETDDNLLAQIETVVENGVLHIRPAKRNANLHSRHMKFVVNATAIDLVTLGGSGSIESDALRGKEVKFKLGGSGSIDVKGIEAEAVSVGVGGSGNFKSGGGNVERMTVSIGGSGDVDVGKVRSKGASISVAGSGEAVVWATEALNATIAGSGDVHYYGNPQVSRTVLGSGNTWQLAAAPK